METLDEYRKYAEECRRLAGKIDAEQYRAVLEEMAEAWSRLAAEAKQKST